ncbi:MAG: DUF4153 domain-containing protein [Pirellulaceae bacterium]
MSGVAGDPPFLGAQSDPIVVHQVGGKRTYVSGKQTLIDLAVLGVWLFTTDWLLYRFGSFTTWAIFFAVSVVFLGMLKLRSIHWRSGLGIGALILCLAVKLIWCGSFLPTLCGLGLLVCFGMALTGRPPFMPEAIGFVGSMILGITDRLGSYRWQRVVAATSRGHSGSTTGSLGLQIALPIGVAGVFLIIFVLANPNVANFIGTQIQWAWTGVSSFFLQFRFSEAVFLGLSGLTLVGLMYPALPHLLLEKTSAPQLAAHSTPLHRAYRNTLLTVIALFAIYLLFEFSTLWFREFPADFYYAGYAHRGAFWLTVALAFATLVLSIIFQGDTLTDPKIASLKCLAMIWSLENLILSVAVYNRMYIYIDFNGMTRMRVIGLLGIACVIAGFILVVIKLRRNYDMVWLLHRQLWVPVLAIIAYASLPVDWVVNRYNVNQVLAGNLAPSVQLVAHETKSSGILPLFDLVDAEDVQIRDGVRALLALWAIELNVEPAASLAPAPREAKTSVWKSPYGHATPWLKSPSVFRNRQSSPSRSRNISESTTSPPPKNAWHEFQWSDSLLRRELERTQAAWAPLASAPERRDEALNAFFKYAYQWY